MAVLLFLVGRVPVDLEQALYLVQHGLLGGIVGGSELFGTFEHQVLEVVGQSGCL